MYRTPVGQLNSYQAPTSSRRVSAGQIQDTGLRDLLAPSFKPVNSYSKLGVATQGALDAEMSKYQSVDPSKLEFQDQFAGIMGKHASGRSALGNKSFFMTPEALERAKGEIGSTYGVLDKGMYDKYGFLDEVKNASPIAISSAGNRLMTKGGLDQMNQALGQNYSMVKESDWGQFSPYADFNMIGKLGDIDGSRVYRKSDWDKAVAGGFEKELTGGIDPLVRDLFKANIVDRDGRSYYTGHMNPGDYTLQGGRTWQDELRDRWNAANPIEEFGTTAPTYGFSEEYGLQHQTDPGKPGGFRYGGAEFYNQPWTQRYEIPSFNFGSDSGQQYGYTEHRAYSRAQLEEMREQALQSALNSPGGRDMLAQILETGKLGANADLKESMGLTIGMALPGTFRERAIAKAQSKIGGDERLNKLTPEQLRMVIGTKGNLVNTKTGQNLGTVLNAPPEMWRNQHNIQSTKTSKNLTRKKTTHNYDVLDVGTGLQFDNPEWYSQNANRLGDGSIFIGADKLASMPGGGSMDWHEHEIGENVSRKYTTLGKVGNFALNFIPVVGPTLSAMQNMYMAGGLSSPWQGVGMVASFVAPGAGEALGKAFNTGMGSIIDKGLQGAAMGAIQGGLSSGTWKGAGMGALTGGLGGMGSAAIGNAGFGNVGNIAANAALKAGIGGLSSSLRGGNFGQGALGGLASYGASTAANVGANYLGNQLGMGEYTKYVAPSLSGSAGNLARSYVNPQRRRPTRTA